MPEVTWASIASRGVPDDLKPIQGQLQRAREVAPHEPEIAYWLLFSAAQDGLKLHPASPESSVFLAELVGSLESAKQSEQIARSPLITDDRLAREHARKFALGVFVRADNQDRAGQADRSTARNFLAAATFLGLIRLFPPVSNEEAGNEAEGDSDIGEKIKYAKWKAADINKALRQGRRPDPGPPGWDPEAERQAREEAQRVLKESQAAEFEEEAHINQATTDIDPAEEAELAREMQKLMEDPSDAPGGTAPLSTAPSSKEEGAEPPEVISTSQEVSVFPTVPQDQGPYDEHARTDIVSDINPEREKDEKLETVDAVRKQRPPLPQPPRSSGEEPAPPATVVEPPSSPGPSPTPGLSAAMPLKRTASHTSRPLPSPPGPSAPPHDADARGLFPALSAPTAPSAPSASPSAPTSSVFPLASPSAPTPPNVPPPPVTNPPTVGLPTPTSNGRAPPLTGMAQAPPSTLPTSLSPQKTAQVQKLAKYAASALDFDDLDTARQELTRALSILNGQA